MMNADGLKVQVDEKEKELRHLQKLQAATLEEDFKEKDLQLKLLLANFEKLKEDFEFNLRVIDERDEELDQYEALCNELEQTLRKKSDAVSSTKQEVNDFQLALSNAEECNKQLQKKYQQSIGQMQMEHESYKHAKEQEIIQQNSLTEAANANYFEKISELESQQDKLSNQIRSANAETEHMKSQLNYRNKELSAAKQKVKHLNKELDLANKSLDTLQAENRKVKEEYHNLERQLYQCKLEQEEAEAEKIARNKEITAKLEENEIYLKNLKSSCDETECQLRDQVLCLQQKLQDNDILVQQKDSRITELLEVVDGLNQQKARLFDQEVLKNANLANKDALIHELTNKLECMKEDQAKLRESISCYRKELAAGADREISLEQSKKQLELDWQKRCEKIEQDQYNKSEELIKKLGRQRDDALASAKESEIKTQELKNIIQVLTRDRDHAFNTLKKHGLILERQNNLNSSDVNEMPEKLTELQQQNEKLKTTIKQMRCDMEQLSQQAQISETATEDRHSYGDCNSPIKYKPFKTVSCKDESKDVNVTSLKEEIANLKTTIRELKLTKHCDTNVEGDEAVISNDNAAVKAHIQKLNVTIGQLRKDKLELTTQCRKQQVRCLHYENQVEQLQKQSLQFQAEINQLRYELESATHHHKQENSSLTSRLKELTIRFQEVKQEAEQYHKALLEQGAEASSLQNEVSDLKMALASNTPSINFGAQELLIQQLQDEICRLKAMNKSDSSRSTQLGHSSVFQPITEFYANKKHMDDIKEKLRIAIEQVEKLTLEREKLMEIGNRLRTELCQARLSQAINKGGNQPGAEGNSKEVKDESMLRKDKDAKDQLRKDKDALSTEDVQNANTSHAAEKQSTAEGSLLLSLSSATSSMKDVWRLLDQSGNSTLTAPVYKSEDAAANNMPKMRAEGTKSNLVVRKIGPLKLSTLGREKRRMRNIRNDT